MNHSIETLSETRAKVTVTVSAEEIAAQDKAALRTVSAQARIPGFRPGKAPEKLLRQRYAKAIADETKHKCVSAAYEYAKDKAGLKVYMLVDAEEGEVVTGKDAAPTFTFDLMPNIVIPEYNGIETKVTPITVEESDIDEQVENIRNSRAKYEPVEREVKAGDYVKVSYKGSLDGKDIAEITDKKIWGTQENTWEEAGEAGPNTLGVPAIIEGIIGMKAGDEKDLEQQFEENHEVEELRGKKGTYHVTVHEVRERVLPELDEEFLKSINVDSVEKMREQIKTEMLNRKNHERRMSQREQIAHHLLDGNEFPIPESAIEAEKQTVIERIMIENMQRGMTREHLEEHKDEINEKSQEIAVIQTRRNFILIEIANKEQIKISNEDINRAIMMQAMRMRVRPEDFAKELAKDRESLRAVQRDIILDKTMDLLASKAVIVEEEAAPEAEGAQV